MEHWLAGLDELEKHVALLPGGALLVDGKVNVRDDVVNHLGRVLQPRRHFVLGRLGGQELDKTGGGGLVEAERGRALVVDWGLELCWVRQVRYMW